MHLLKDTLLSFGLSLIYPFFTYLIPGFLRIPALSDPKKDRKCLYDFSKFLQMFWLSILKMDIYDILIVIKFLEFGKDIIW